MNSDLNPIVTRKSTAAEKNSFQWSQNSLFLNPQNSLDLFPHPRPIPPEFCINYCFQMLWEDCIFPRALIWNNSLFMQNVAGKQSVLWGIR